MKVCGSWGSKILRRIYLEHKIYQQVGYSKIKKETTKWSDFINTENKFFPFPEIILHSFLRSL
jgi:hypothetical protein